MPEASDHAYFRHRGRGSGFATTRWSVVLAAGRQESIGSQRALADLCDWYWYPLYCYVRRQGYSTHDAQDLTQAFFARLLEKNFFSDDVDQQRGRFRAFLLAALKHFMSNERDRARAQKRGGGQTHVAWDFGDAEDRYAREPADGLTPERIYERRCAVALVERALDRLRGHYARAGKEDLFERIKGILTGEGATSPYADVARDLGATAGAVKVAVHRLRKRFRHFLREEVAQTVDDPSEIETELRDLQDALG
ncbi:MAG TPA: RNA polymerase subunit sigma-24 [Pirellulales bacterium]|nr:RNA polymerase subunit sigma-24 [Pirellulales bacterium]